jgi:ubiquinone/menaquinone biosynthesis C-methylase UbiE
MATTNSDKAWTAYGKKDPYYGVLTHAEYKDENLTEEALQRFFQSGEEYISKLISLINKHFDEDFKPKNALDFGCGTGRLSIPLAQRADKVVGIDVSQDMLSEATKNAEKFKLKNVEFKLSDDELSQVKGQTFDLVNSYIVLQHINVERGMQIIAKMLKILKPGGIGALQITYSSNKLRTNKIATYLRYRIPLVHGILNLLKGAPYSKPLMQMNLYDMNAVLHVLQQNEVENTNLKFEDHGDFWSANLVFQKKARN